jgi:L-serine dehydratase
VAISLFDLFKIGVGPSSSHTVGPMRAAYRFVEQLALSGAIDDIERLCVDVYGSLALTGKGHGTDRGILLGLMGERPDSVDPATIATRVADIQERGELLLFGRRRIRFRPGDGLLFHFEESLPGHPNGLRFTAWRDGGVVLDSRVYYSVGGGFVREEGETRAAENGPEVRFPFRSAAELLRLGAVHNLQISEIALANELAWRPETEVRTGIQRIWDVMRRCILRGLATEGVLPGGLNVRRRAARLARNLAASAGGDPLSAMDWINVYAIAVNEENAAGGRVVTAPTNGAAGVIPAVVNYYCAFLGGDAAGIERFFLGASAIGALYMENASISGAEVGCQGEVGVACSMAAAGMVSALNGSNDEVEHAAEIGMEHNLGLTCDPVGGLVQIPCIERNAFGAVKAVNAAHIAMQGAGEHKVSLDQVIRTMYQTGLDMRSRYKETALGGLALNVIEC